MNTPTTPVDFQRLLDQLIEIRQTAGEPWDDEVPADKLMCDFLQNSWERCRDGLLRRTSILSVEPEPWLGPRVYRFKINCPYKRKAGTNGPVELMPGPVSGMIHYRRDMFASPELPYIAVQIDPRLGYFHPNCSRRRGSLVCLGEIPPTAFPFALDLLLENHLYPIVTYQNRHPAHPFDEEAARYFALEPTAMQGLEPAKPLY